MQLDKIQAQFKDLMLDHPDALSAVDGAFADQFETGRIGLPDRLKVYRNNIVGSLSDVVVASFPLLENLVGKEFLEGCARSFILQSPPNHGCLNAYGAGFDAFLKGFPPAQPLPYLPGVAALELAMNAAYYAPDEARLNAADLSAIAPEAIAGVRLKPLESVHFINSPYPLLAIKAFCEAGGGGELNLDQGGGMVMVARPVFEVQLSALATDEHLALSNMQNGLTLGESVEAVLAAFPEFDFQAFLQKHLAIETFAGL